jgi:UMF1 family MFS transporter
LAPFFIPALTSLLLYSVNMTNVSKKVINGWAMYDWANSAYNLVITSTIFPFYYTAITHTAEHGDRVKFFGSTFINTALSNYAIAFAYLLIALLSPLLSSVADYRGNKKRFMQFFCYLGSLACCGLFFFRLSTLEWGIICFILAAIGYCGSIVFYNAYLPEIAPEHLQDKVSARGFAYGYIGSVILQIICLVFILEPDWFGFTDSTFAPRLSFLLTGIWWLAFAQITFRRLPEPRLRHPEKKQLLTHGFYELKKVWGELKTQPLLKLFLAAFFFYSMGVQTVMLVAAFFAEKTLHLNASQLIGTILVIQLVAIAGAWLMAVFSGRIGNIRVLQLVVLIWVGICIGAYFVQNALQFYLLAALVGLVMGGIQSLSRSTYSRFLPETKDTASYFSFYDVTEKVAIVIGMFSFAFMEEWTGNIRNSVLPLIGFFALGYLMLMWMRAMKRRLQKPAKPALTGMEDILPG